ncbi:stomatin-like protein 1 [Montipora foliosa]|uniref:stomatin-like protein 1 n=1 Tax=Montipora foliosa TaxID=591990 RepID=UPI0035F1E284
MSKAFTYTRLPEHQVAGYHDGSKNSERPSEWNILECLFSISSCLLLVVTFPISIFFCLKVIKDFERAVIFRLGRLLPPKGPGVVFINPCIDTWTRVDTRARAFSVPPQQIRTSDGGYASAGAEVHFCIKDPVLSKTAVRDLNHSLRMLAQTTLSHSLASRKLIEVQHDRKFINKQVQEVVNSEAAGWGVEVKRIEMSEVNVLKEADEPVGALSALFGGGLQSAKLGNMSFADPGLAKMFSALGSGSIRSAPIVPDSSINSSRSDAGVNLLTPEELVKLVSGVLNESLVKEIGGMFQFDVVGESGGTWYLDLRSGNGRIYTDKPTDKPDVVLTMSVDDMQKIFYGLSSAFDAYMQGDLKVEGDLKMAMSLEAIVKILKAKPVIPDKQVSQRPGEYIV